MKHFIIFLFAISFGLNAQSSFKVESFSPEGIIKNPKQVSVRFSEDIVAFGDSREMGSVFETNCSDLGTSRWLDSKNWVFDFLKPLESGNVCKFTISNSLTSLNGGKISGRSTFQFSTGGVNIQYSSPWNSSTIVEDQIILLKLDGLVDEKSAIQKSYFVSDGSADKIYVKQVTGRQLDEVLKAAYWNNLDRDRILALAPKTEFPTESNVNFVWPKEIQSRSGIQNDKDQKLTFKVRPKFQASFYCERENAQKHCIPFSSMEVRFSSAIDQKYVNGIYLQDSKGKRYNPDLKDYDKNSNTIQHLTFSGPFNEKENFTIHIASNIKDDSGRSLSNIGSFPLKVKTDQYPPLAKFSSLFGILESKASPILPVTIRNLESRVTGRIFSLSGENITAENMSHWMSTVHAHTRDKSIFEGSKEKISNLEVPKTLTDGSMEVVGIPLLKPGFYVVELKSRILGQSLLGKSNDLFVPTIALVTNLSVHFKWGRENSLVWVTELSTGKPVSGAQISLSDCQGKIYARGKTFANGTFRVSKLPDRDKIPYCSWNTYNNGLFVIANLDNDTSFTHSNWNQGIENWRFNLPYATFRSEQLVHTVLDRSLLRVGDTLNLKHYVRKHSSKGFVAPDLKSVPSFVMIKHEGTEELYFHKINWAFPGQADSKWKIPNSAHLGNYSVYLANSDKDKWGLEKLSEFRVEEFRLPVLQASVTSKQSTWVNTESIPISLQAKYMAGGAASNLPIKLRYKISPSGFNPNGWNNFIFSSPKTNTGRMHTQNQSRESLGYTTTDMTLNKEGVGAYSIVWKDREEVSSAFIEMEFRDPNGEVQSVSNRISLLPSSQFVGIKTDSYSMNQEDVSIDTAVVNSNGRAVPNSEVEVHAFKIENFTHRKRLVGGFYSYEYYSEIKSIGKVCSGKTNTNGVFKCINKKFPETGNILFEARSKDTKGNLTYASNQVWISGKGDWWYTASDNDRMDIELDKPHYNSGDKAKIHIKSPFANYTALITVEREGVIKTFVREVDGKNPYVEIPIETEFAPNVFISVMAVRGRVGNPKETAMVDLAKPSFRVGMKEIKVGWDPYRLLVDVSSDKKEYQVRSKANINIKVQSFDKKAITNGGEIAIGIVDEALLELSDNKTSDLLSAMMASRGMEVDSYSGQLQVVGKRHFGKKAVPAGGGGGKQPTRELLDTLLYWNPSLKLDNRGIATINVPVGDALTSYRIVAVATSGVNSFGTGQASFSATQDVLLFSGLPPVVRTGDRYFQEYTLKNNTKQNKTLEILLSADAVGVAEKFKAQTISLNPGESKKVGWDVLIGEKVGSRSSIIEVKEGGKSIDRLKVSQKIEASVPLRVVQGTLFQLDSKKEMPISLPKDGLTGKSQVDVLMDSSVMKSMDSIKEYMEIYPYTCMEQKVSKAIISENSQEIQSVISEISGHLDQDGLVKYFPSSNWGSEILTAYILSISHEAGWKLPKQNVDSMLTGLNRFLDGTLVRHKQYNFSDGIMRRLQVMEAISRYNSISVGNRIDEMEIDVKLLPTSSLLDTISIMNRLSKNTKRSSILKDAETNLRSRLNIQGREMVIADKAGDLWWLMGSQDQDAARVVSYALDTPSYKPDLGRMAIGFMNRMKDGRFRTTLANSYGYLAMKKFGNTQEKETVSGNTELNLNSMKRVISWSGKPKENYSTTLPMNQEIEGTLSLNHSGSGKPWVSVFAKSAIPLKKNWDNGIRIRKSTTAMDRKSGGKWSVGDIVKVKIEWELDAPRTWVVINDPVPTGSTILGSGLGRDSALSSEDKIQNSDYYSSFQERGFSGFRSYYEYLPAGKYNLEYSFRINQEGKFTLPPTRGEAMYSPDIFGETPNEDWVILP
ncbi:MAG: hypothetical protein JJT78_10060 [Leptospira sp.]|nr:hypothetical protein [Leptospira sp.]